MDENEFIPYGTTFDQSRGKEMDSSLQYKGLTSHPFIESMEKMKTENPRKYNLMQQRIAARNSPHSEIIRYTDANGNVQTSTQVIGMSGTDPIGQMVVEGAVLGKPLQIVGKGISYVTKRLPKIQKFITHPTYTKVYHGSNKNFQLKDAVPYSATNVGIHVTPSKKMAQSFVKGDDASLKSAYIPKENATTIDIWENNWRWLDKNHRFQARPKGSGSSYATAGNDELKFNLLKQAGANPSYSKNYSGQTILNTEDDAIINLRQQFKNIPDKEADEIVKLGNTFDMSVNLKARALDLNRRTSELLSKNNYKVIKYNNSSAYEGGGGTAYAITDPSVFWTPTWKSININPKLQYLAPLISISHD